MTAVSSDSSGGSSLTPTSVHSSPILAFPPAPTGGIAGLTAMAVQNISSPPILKRRPQSVMSTEVVSPPDSADQESRAKEKASKRRAKPEQRRYVLFMFMSGSMIRMICYAAVAVVRMCRR